MFYRKFKIWLSEIFITENLEKKKSHTAAIFTHCDRIQGLVTGNWKQAYTT